MKCKHCGAEIADNSVFCENCGKKVVRKKRGLVISLIIILGIGAIFGIISIINYSRWKDIYDNHISSWPECTGGDGTFYILQNGEIQSLVKVKGEFPIQKKQVADVYGKVFACGGEHSGLAAFALLDNSGQISFATDYNKGGCLIDGFLFTSTTEDGQEMYADEYHIYGYAGDIACGQAEENVEILFPGMLGQPVKIGDKWRYVLVGGQYMFDDEFDDAYPFCYGIARVIKNGRFSYIDGSGHELKIFDGETRFEVVNGGQFLYDYDLGKVVATMHLLRLDNNSVYTAKVDISGQICEYI